MGKAVRILIRLVSLLLTLLLACQLNQRGGNSDEEPADKTLVALTFT